ncbi:CBS domain-containing protein [Gilvimarinus sp. SDUM040013]|uniref:CBS domain-containing protein n=1 Tax=Gilvimarinus gilvus TaxID=3058038 RepID=A0ABU4RVQ7_9GAMM|nr:CBS domain-containing protein [Gilvimarinus sp. SDUM040013]MDO3387266.1 CBS domain-containing protein [Gilvimarinus sp. SDUM040013]MDX6848955.1 CBS domain-containing protein [Gilvimarinus sp. SDUM040013]
MTTHVDCAYEGWSLQRLQNLLNQKELTRVPVIASDHQLVGSVGSADIYRLMNQEETYRAQLVNDNFRRTTGSDIDNLDELTQWSRRAQVYCTVHQIMQPADNQIDISASQSELKAAMLHASNQTLWVTRLGLLVGKIEAVDLLTDC